MKGAQSMVFRLLFIAVLAFCANAYGGGPGDAERGREIFKHRGCPICHSIDRVGGTVGPDLTQVTVRRTDEGLVNWLKDPPSLLKDTDMPKVPWKEEQEIFDLIAYFKTFRREINRDFMGKVSKKEAGKRLIKEYDCRSCHRIIDPESGRDRFPELTHEGRKRDRAWLDRWLKDPQAVKPGTFMPAYPLSNEERVAIVEYLTTLK
ncbi:MAG: cytochrome c [Deltaproteobacteria bacterium]|nr:cytochrome c [Deltaproteobacteria bacterium]